MSHIDLDTDWSLVSFEPPKAKEPAPALDKGTCPKCGKHVGKGVHFHVRSCDGDPSKAV